MILDLIKPDSSKFYGIIALFKERLVYRLFTRRAWIIPENECSGAISVFRQVRRNASKSCKKACVTVARKIRNDTTFKEENRGIVKGNQQKSN